MRYCETVELDPGASPTGSVQHLIYPQQVCDPLNHDDDNHQPWQYDQAMTYYDRATVIGAKVRARLVPESNDSVPQYWGMCIDHATDSRYDLVSKDHDELQMMQGIPRLSLTNFNHYKGRQGYDRGLNRVIKYSPKKFFRDRNIMRHSPTGTSSNNYSCGAGFASGSTLVDEPVIKLFSTGCNIGTLNPTAVYFQITMDFIVVLTHKEVVAPEPDA